MNDDPNHESYLDHASSLVGVRIPPEARPGVLRFFALAATLASQVAAFELPDEVEPAPVYRAGEPVGPQLPDASGGSSR